MITAMDLLRGASGAYVLVVPANIPAGELSLILGHKEVFLHHDGVMVAHVRDVEEKVIEALAALPQVGLIEAVEGQALPTHISHWAQVKRQ